MPEDTNGIPAQPVSGQQVSRQQFADIAASHFQAVRIEAGFNAYALTLNQLR